MTCHFLNDFMFMKLPHTCKPVNLLQYPYIETKTDKRLVLLTVSENSQIKLHFFHFDLVVLVYLQQEKQCFAIKILNTVRNTV